MDTIFSSVDDSEVETLLETAKNNKGHSLSREELLSFAKAKASDFNVTDGFIDSLTRAAAQQKLGDVTFALNLLGTRAGSLALTGHFKAYKDLTRKEREEVMKKWSTSSLEMLRGLHKLFYQLTVSNIFKQMDCPLHKVMGYPGPDPHMHGEKHTSKLKERYEFLNIPEGVTELNYDVVVVGTGAGGGPVAATLAKAGKKVLVLEKAKYVHESEFELNEVHGFTNFYERGTIFSNLSGSMNIYAGSAFGGATTINWCASLKPQHFVRDEWASEGLSHFVSSKFTEQLDQVYQRIGATTKHIKHNEPNSILIEGCKRLGYPIEDIPQNVGEHPHECGWCFLGCRYNEKNGSMNTWLRDAREAGAEFVDQCYVDRVLVKKGKAVGVECTIAGNKNRKLIVHSKQVVVSAGSLNSPGVLMRSGLKNKNIGKHLHMHPCHLAFGVFPDREINLFQGSIMTALSNISENHDGTYYGAKLEVPVLHPGSFSAVVPWRGAADYKRHVLRYRNISPVLILSRDKDSEGTVTYDDNNNVIVDYNVTARDKKSILIGVEKALDVLVAAGAEELFTVQSGVDNFHFIKGEEDYGQINNKRYVAWKEKVKAYGLPDAGCGQYNAHQMGSCRMGVSPKVSVVKPGGETWEVKNLYVADASVFPSATGVNPMVTTEACALYIADTILQSDAVAPRL
ncbi:hypothetical protein K450DRAFT_168598 [Umbelopsis ramanniana AG]|uniref:Long-chain-alcohol oxidase n=1 Tax=Umbelopsis ramanniana AG TaxID=1314678 RepID=A0AAD5EJ95_UMBRA|nr:uncharacterized protein K450DRAFT_168598 [Umbelopsis ramanniana AG]KAI8584284.1 hypothetical protein K450DRAFT_168598 [Umbelopsis ramanniana AG]